MRAVDAPIAHRSIAKHPCLRRAPARSTSLRHDEPGTRYYPTSERGGAALRISLAASLPADTESVGAVRDRCTGWQQGRDSLADEAGPGWRPRVGTDWQQGRGQAGSKSGKQQGGTPPGPGGHGRREHAGDGGGGGGGGLQVQHVARHWGACLVQHCQLACPTGRIQGGLAPGTGAQVAHRACGRGRCRRWGRPRAAGRGAMRGGAGR